MIEISSSLEGKQYPLYDLELELKQLGYTIGGNWDYDHGYFDYLMDDDNGYHFLRIPFRAVDGQLDAHNATVRLGRPFILTHKYKEGLDDHAVIGNFQASFNQFSEPAEKDADVSEPYVQLGETLIQELERRLN
jgi:YugN-like family